MVIIFWLSSRTAEESAGQSSFVLEWLRSLFGENAFSDFIVRKAAHCLEFTGLSFLFNIALMQTRKKPQYVQAVIFTSLYAITDEVHQIFVDGRSCQLMDWGIDTFGAALGAIGFLVIFTIIQHYKKSVDTKAD